MLRRLVCLSMLLALPCAASAGETSAAERVIVTADASADAAPALDLSFDPKPTAQSVQPTAPRAPAHPESAAEAPFSLGIDIKTRPEVGDETRQSASEPTLSDEVEGVVRRSTFGVTGTYRF